MSNSTERIKGFTIVEILIVVAVIGILASATVLAYNGITQRSKDAAQATEISEWQKTADLYRNDRSIVCPYDFVFVYGNPTFGTSDFCVMQYEAKKSPTNIPISTASGTPWISISQTTALTTATTACGGCHLISDAEWMTIAADVLSVKYNWMSGVVGTGSLYVGHSDGDPANIISIDDDTDGYAGTGNSKTSSPNQKRSFILTSGDTIWDIAGNAWELTSGSITGAQPGLASDNANGTTYSWKQWNSAGMNWNNLPAASRPTAVASIPGLATIGTWTEAYGIGQLYSNQNQTAKRVLMRGGSWGTNSNSGVMTLLMSYTVTDGLTSVGFRAAR